MTAQEPELSPSQISDTQPSSRFATDDQQDNLHQPIGPVVFALLSSFTTLVISLDVFVFQDVPLPLLYLPAVYVLAARGYRLGALAISVVASSTWLLGLELSESPLPDLYTGGSIAITVFIFFVLILVLLGKLRQAKRTQNQLARTDALTSLGNSASFMESAKTELKLSRKSSTPLSMAFVDCDNFKQFNDNHGHLTGNELLKSVAQVLTQNLESCGYISRFGGDEFAILLNNTDERMAQTTMNAAHAALNQKMLEKEWPVTFSAGVVTFLQLPKSVDDLIRTADDLMYAVKKSGKNAIQFQSVPSPSQTEEPSQDASLDNA